MMSRDYRLDPVIRRTCRPDIQNFCEGQDESLQATIDTKGTVMECLKRNHEQLKRRPCRDAVARSIERSARNVRYATGIAGSCQDDRTKLCSGLRPVRFRIVSLPKAVVLRVRRPAVCGTPQLPQIVGQSQA